MHAHAVATVLVGLEGPIRVRPRGGRWRRVDQIFLTAGCVHELDCGDHLVAVVFSSPGRDDERAFRERWQLGSVPTASLPPMERLREAAWSALRGELGPDDARRELDALIGAPPPMRTSPDRRVERVLAAIVRDPAAPLETSELRRRTSLSASGLRALVRRSTGLSLREFRRWQRMRGIAAELARGGSDLTAAAHALGFTDSAQLSRDFRATFGVPPTRVLGAGCEVAVHGLA